MKKGILAILIVVVCTAVYFGIRYTHDTSKSIEAVLGTYEDSVETECFFAREETVYNAGISGSVYNRFADGMRVKKDTLISTVFSGNVNDDTLQELNTLEKKIENLQLSNSTYYAVANDDSNLENRIDGYKAEIITASLSNDVNTISKYKDIVNSLRANKDNETTEEQIATLEMEKEKVESQMGDDKQEIISNESGLFSIVLDGMEHILTPELVKQYTVDDYDALVEPSEKTANKTVTAGDSVCKLVNNHKWYVVCTLSEERVQGKELNTTVKMRFDSIPGVDVVGKIEYISDAKDGKCVVVIESGQYVESAYSMRKGSVEIVFKQYEGYKVPMAALRVQDGVKGIVAKKKNVEDFYPIEILFVNNNADYVIIASPKDAEKKLTDVDEFVLPEGVN